MGTALPDVQMSTGLLRPWQHVHLSFVRHSGEGVGAVWLLAALLTYCITQREVDARSTRAFAHPRVRSRMNDFAQPKLDVTQWTAENTKLLRFLNVQGPRRFSS